MKNKRLYIIIALLFTALAGLLIMQIYFIKNAYAQKEQAFENNVITAMNKTAAGLEMLEAARNVIDIAKQDIVPGRANDKHLKEVITHRDTIIKKRPRRMMVFNYSFSDSFTGNNQPVKIVVGTDESKTQMGRFYSWGDVDNVHGMVGVTVNGNDCTAGSFSYSGACDTTYVRIDAAHALHLTGKDTMIINQAVKSGKAKIVTKVVDRLMLVENKPIEQRVNKKDLDSILKHNLSEAGIVLPYIYGVAPAGRTAPVLTSNNYRANDLTDAKFSARLFPAEILSAPNKLLLNFPDREMFLFREILPLLSLSLIFILIIVFSLIYTLSTFFRQRRFSDQVKDFINNMTHEFKTPISTISLASEAIANPMVIENESKLKRYNGIVRDEIARMKSHVEKILQMAVIEEGDYVLENKPVNINSVILSGMQNYTLRVEACGGKVSAALAELDPIVSADRLHLSNIINNLLDNAVKYSPDKPEIHLTTELDNGWVVIRISDKGVGIAKENINKVFDKYYRVTTGNTHDIKGYGLGLSYVKMMVEAQRGMIKLESKPGKGTSVILRFPLV